MDYLVYIEHGAENLQFYLWYQDYCKRWGQLSRAQQALSPAVEQSGIRTEMQANDVPRPSLARKGSRLTNILSRVTSGENDWESLHDRENRDITMSQMEKYFPPLDLAGTPVSQWKMSSHQPLRDECNQVIRHYLAFGAPRELNLSHKDRAACLKALSQTTHPSAFTSVIVVCRATLQAQSHPNFIRWSICNGNKPRILAVRYAATAGIMSGCTVAVLLALSHLSRWWRLFAILGYYPGFAALIAAYKGICVIMYFAGNGTKKNLRPWEQFIDDEESAFNLDINTPSKPSLVIHSPREGYNTGTKFSSWKLARTRIFNPFGPENKEWENSGWVNKYEGKSLFGKIFEKETWIENEHLKFLQEKIVWSANVWALFITVALTALFLSVPSGDFY